MSAKNGYFALFFFLFSLPAFGVTVETCKLSGKIILDRETEYVCASGDFVIEKGTEIVSKGKFAKIRTTNYDQCIVDNGLTFISYQGEEDAPNGKDGGQLKFEAGCIRGECASIHNDFYKQGFGGPIVYEIKGGYAHYKCHDISPQEKIVAFDSYHKEIPFSDFKKHVID
jgi:hypothetical protein